MDLITFLVLVAVIGFVVYLLVTYIPMPEPFKPLIIAIACLVIILLLLRILGFSMAIPRIR